MQKIEDKREMNAKFALFAWSSFWCAFVHLESFLDEMKAWCSSRVQQGTKDPGKVVIKCTLLQKPFRLQRRYSNSTALCQIWNGSAVAQILQCKESA